MAVSIVQIPMWCLNIHRTPVREQRYVMQRYVTYVMHQAQVPDGAWCITYQTAN